MFWTGFFIGFAVRPAIGLTAALPEVRFPTGPASPTAEFDGAEAGPTEGEGTGADRAGKVV